MSSRAIVRSGITLPLPFITAIERSLAAIGSFASPIGLWLLSRESGSLAAVRPWWQFFDLSAIQPRAENGWKEYIHRIKANAGFFKLNYLQVGLFAAAASTVTEPMVLLGVAGLAVVYFKLFGETVDELLDVGGGITLGHDEKVGIMMILGCLVFIYGAGGIKVFRDIVVATFFVTLLHGAMRTVPTEAETVV